jgi:hypothetical protein
MLQYTIYPKLEIREMLVGNAWGVVGGEVSEQQTSFSAVMQNQRVTSRKALLVAEPEKCLLTHCFTGSL